MMTEYERRMAESAKDGEAQLAHALFLISKRVREEALSFTERLRWFVSLNAEQQASLLNPKVVPPRKISERALKRMFGGPKVIGMITVPTDSVQTQGFINNFVTTQSGQFEQMPLLIDEVVSELSRPSCAMVCNQQFQVIVFRASEAFDAILAVDFLVHRGLQLPGLYGGMLIWEQLGRKTPRLFGWGHPEKSVLFLDHKPCLPRDSCGNPRLPEIDVYRQEGLFKRSFGWGDMDFPFLSGTHIVGLRPVQ